MQKTIIIILAGILFLFVLVPLISATPGRLNSFGCHNSATAGYHCHESSSTYTDTPQSNPVPTTSYKKNNSETCITNSDCQSTFCVHSVCREKNYFTGDGFCDSSETCLTSPGDCGLCENNHKCDTFAGETCETTQDCQCSAGQVCATGRTISEENGCYPINCGDNFVDEGETSENCCLDIPCASTTNFLKKTNCNEISYRCETKFKLSVKLISVAIVIFIFLIVYIRIKVNKTQHAGRYK